MRATVWRRESGRLTEVGRDCGQVEMLGGDWRAWRALLGELPCYCEDRMSTLIDLRRKMFGRAQDGNVTYTEGWCLVVGCDHRAVTASTVCAHHLRLYRPGWAY